VGVPARNRGIGQNPCGVPEHVGVHRELELGGNAKSGDRLAETRGGEWRAALGDEDERGSRRLPA
jgi:hypothetical protein